MPSRKLILKFAALALLRAAAAHAQDPFEIQVYEYDTVKRGMWNLETHLNYIGKGTKEFEGTVAPTNNQFHMTYELTAGLSKNWELAGYLVTARRPGNPMEYAGWRVRPRFKIPQEWNWPVKVSMSFEVGFPRQIYEENKVTLELRPIIEKSWGKWQLDVNPTVGRALKGPGTSEGFDFEPAVRMAYAVRPKLDLSTEYYGSTGPVFHWLPGHEQVHQFYPGGDWQLKQNLVLNFGVGMAATSTGNKLVYKIRIGWQFGKESI